MGQINTLSKEEIKNHFLKREDVIESSKTPLSVLGLGMGGDILELVTSKRENPYISISRSTVSVDSSIELKIDVKNDYRGELDDALLMKLLEKEEEIGLYSVLHSSYLHAQAPTKLGLCDEMLKIAKRYHSIVNTEGYAIERSAWEKKLEKSKRDITSQTLVKLLDKKA